jgi:peptide deformylase
MSVREILRYPHPILRTPTEPVREFGRNLEELIQDLWDTMESARGVGLAANQIGSFERVCVLHPKNAEEEHPRVVLVNPQIVSASGELRWEEGCLSIPGFTAEVVRYATVVVSAQTPRGEQVSYTFTGFPAVVAQHEIDHLDGILFVDRLSWVKRQRFEREFGKDPYRKRIPASLLKRP